LDRRRVRGRRVRQGGDALRLARPERAQLGCLGTIAIGVLGGLIGGALTAAATGEKITHFGVKSIVIAFLGAVLLLLVVQAIATRRA
jgi:uncharacterized membrane protein YeaQ/YmgE (transglycosylase-associated protein family)